MSTPQGDPIKIVLVDDIAETRESIKKLLAFEQDFQVVGSASNGREGVNLVKEVKPDIVIMDINMPDMDGLEAAGLITKAVPTTGVIMMSVQDDTDYIQKAMLAGARFFLSKPVNMDQLYSTIRNVYNQYSTIREQFANIESRIAAGPIIQNQKPTSEGNRAGYIIAVYSPQGGSGKTTIATNLASGLMKEGIKTLLVDADLEFADVGAFLDLRSQTTIAELSENADDIDIDYFESVTMTHDSGLKVLLGPSRPSIGSEIRDLRPESVATVINTVAGHYDFIVVDLGTSINAVTASILDIANKIVLICTPTLPSIKNVKMVIDLFDQTGFAPEKSILMINKAIETPGRNQRSIIAPEKIQAYLKRPVEGMVPLVDEVLILNAINKGVPVIASDRDINRAPIKQMLQFSDHVYATLMGVEDDDLLGAEETESKSSRGFAGFFGGNR